MQVCSWIGYPGAEKEEKREEGVSVDTEHILRQNACLQGFLCSLRPQTLSRGKVSWADAQCHLGQQDPGLPWTPASCCEASREAGLLRTKKAPPG